MYIEDFPMLNIDESVLVIHIGFASIFRSSMCNCLILPIALNIVLKAVVLCS